MPGSVDPIDALIVINEINLRRISNAQGRLPDVFSGTNYYDVDGDGFVAPVDALMVINHINARSGVGPEGEALANDSAGEFTAVPLTHNSAPSPLNAAAASILFAESELESWFDATAQRVARRRHR